MQFELFHRGALAHSGIRDSLCVLRFIITQYETGVERSARLCFLAQLGMEYGEDPAHAVVPDRLIGVNLIVLY